MEQKLKIVVSSANLDHYKLSKSLKAIFERHDQMREYVGGTGKTLPNFIRIKRSDYVAVDRAVREQSGGKYHAGTVAWKGRSLLPADATPQEFNLEQSP